MWCALFYPPQDHGGTKNGQSRFHRQTNSCQITARLLGCRYNKLQSYSQPSLNLIDFACAEKECNVHFPFFLPSCPFLSFFSFLFCSVFFLLLFFLALLFMALIWMKLFGSILQIRQPCMQIQDIGLYKKNTQGLSNRPLCFSWLILKINQLVPINM